MVCERCGFTGEVEDVRMGDEESGEGTAGRYRDASCPKLKIGGGITANMVVCAILVMSQWKRGI